MSDNFFTFMIIPRKKSAVKKICLSNNLVRTLFIGTIVAILLTFYVIYDYASIKRDRAELSRLRIETKQQSQNIEELALKIDEFADRMEELKQFDKKLRILANYQTSRDKKLPLGIGGSGSDTIKMKELLKESHENLVAGMRKSIAGINEDADYRERSFNELLSFLREQKSLLAATPSVWPVKGWVTSEFGMRESPFNSGTEFHKGIDIATRMGKEVIATADGIVVEASYSPADGNLVKIEHGYGMSSAYAHLLKFVVKKGIKVKRGTL
ncbi:MAG TPA: M23 family metallopeptidase, partial [Smithellaceae bacterium]|nr:M23 family metallopeptidase [Smithellaceae bacterium]